MRVNQRDNLKTLQVTLGLWQATIAGVYACTADDYADLPDEVKVGVGASIVLEELARLDQLEKQLGVVCEMIEELVR
jgi:hypothetical protein